MCLSHFTIRRDFVCVRACVCVCVHEKRKQGIEGEEGGAEVHQDKVL